MQRPPECALHGEGATPDPGRWTEQRLHTLDLVTPLDHSREIAKWESCSGYVMSEAN